MDTEREQILDEIRSMPYGDSYAIPHEVARKCFAPPERRLTLSEIEAEITALLNAPRGQYVSNLPPEDAPRTPREVLERELGDEYRVSDGMWNITVHKLLSKCPRCGGSGWYLQSPPLPLTRIPSVEFNALAATVQYELIQCNHQPL